MRHSALAAGIRRLRGKMASQQGNDDSDEQLLNAFNLEGKGIAGVNVSASIHSMRSDKNHKPLPFDAPDKEGQYWGNILPSANTNAVTDKEGHFVLRGLSRGWLYDLYISGPTVVHAKAQLVARPDKPTVVGAAGIAPPDRPLPRLTRFGSTFTYVAAPCKPIDSRPLPAWPGYFHAYRLIDVVQGKETCIDIRLVPGDARPLRVEYPDGKAHDTVVHGLKPSASDPGERYFPGKSAILGLADDETRRLFLATYDRRFGASAVVRGKEKGPITVKVKPTGTITGRLVDKDGKPLVGVWFQLYFEDGPGRPGVLVHGGYVHRLHTEKESQRSFRTRGFSNDKAGFRAEQTDEQGRFRLSGVLPDVAFDLQAVPVAPPNQKGERLTLGEFKIARPTVKPGETLDLGTLQFTVPRKK